jgi:hypothetical protein
MTKINIKPKQLSSSLHPFLHASVCQHTVKGVGHAEGRACRGGACRGVGCAEADHA